MTVIRLKHKESAIKTVNSRISKKECVDIKELYHEVDSKVNDTSIKSLLDRIDKYELNIVRNKNFTSIEYEGEIILNVVSSYNNETYPLHEKLDLEVSELLITLHNGIKPIYLDKVSTNKVIGEILKEVEKYK